MRKAPKRHVQPCMRTTIYTLTCVQTDLDERVTGEWNEQEVAVQSVSSLIVPA